MIRSFLLLVLLLNFFNQVIAQTSNRNCNWQSKTPPAALNGNEGSLSAKKYWFGHLADVDIENKKHKFIYQIKNLHTERVLPVAWVLGNGTPQIRFTMISPGGCATNDFETFALFKEDPNAMIKYGPKMQETKKASLYWPEQAEARKGDSQLTSTLVADVQDSEGKQHRLSLEVTTEYRDENFVHAIRNFGSHNEILRIPALSAIRQSNPSLMVINEWSMDGDLVFVNNNERPHTFSFTFSGNASIQEKLISVEVVSRNFSTGETEILATAGVVLYLPVIEN